MTTAPDGTVRPIRYRWAPTVGVDGITDDEALELPHDYLATELEDRLASGTISFTLNFIVGDTNDPIDDPTIPFPVNRPRITAGVLTFDRMVDDHRTECELLSYNPTRVGNGFDLSDDPLLAARGRAYAASSEQRGACPVTGS